MVDRPALVQVGPRLWRLQEDFIVRGHKVPSGFIFNGASVPRWLWWFLTPAGTLLYPSILHDYQYRHNIGCKPEADRNFKELALLYGATKLEANLAYLAVSWFGWWREFD